MQLYKIMRFWRSWKPRRARGDCAWILYTIPALQIFGPGSPEKRLNFFTLTKNPSAAGRNRKRVLIQNWLPMPRRDMKNRQRKTAEAASGQLSAAKFAA